ncbi:MAG: SDR family NAD(P)-dependent oxidoreductase [Clostridia bacterium]|nr:SDR family NAD(P)-dependent oxidoreductase [Clostridia bacterium]
MEYVVVTGAYGGMGRATCKLLASRGYTVFALDKKVFDKEDGIIPIEVDVTSEQSVLNATSEIEKITPVIKAVIHYAGVYVLDSLVEMSEQRFISAFNVNLFGVYRLNKALIPLLKGGKIIITTSELAPLDPLPFTGVYAITKSALDKYAYSLRMEVQLLDISVSVIRAGAVETGLLNVSTTELDKFISETKLYTCNAERFKKVVTSVEAKSVKPEKIASVSLKIVNSKRPRYVYNVNRNGLLLLLNALPKKLQTFIIKKILK